MEITPDTVAAYRAAIATEGAALARLAESGWKEPVPTCPGFDVATLVAHTGSAQRWAAANLTAGERVRYSQLEPAPEDEVGRLAWFGEGLASLLSAADSVDPLAEVWTFAPSGERRSAWWLRRMAGETSVHRWDAGAAVAAATGGPPPGPVEARVAADGIDEYFDDFLPRLPAETFTGWSGTLHLHASDTEGEWLIDLAAMTQPARREHAKADTALRGPASDLLLWLWNRQPATGVEVFGDPSPIERWRQITI
jgi:uncharacterized protein (TIGR03083 family)